MGVGGLELVVLIVLPILIGLWVGVVGLSKAGRGGAWWAMLAGVVLLSLGLVVTTVGTILLFQSITASIGSASSGGSTASYEWVQVIAVGGAICLGMGLLSFTIGFALHGFKVRRVRERISELEMVVEAQTEQIERGG